MDMSIRAPRAAGAVDAAEYLHLNCQKLTLVDMVRGTIPSTLGRKYIQF